MQRYFLTFAGWALVFTASSSPNEESSLQLCVARHDNATQAEIDLILHSFSLKQAECCAGVHLKLLHA